MKIYQKEKTLKESEKYFLNISLVMSDKLYRQQSVLLNGIKSKVVILLYNILIAYMRSSTLR